MRTALLYNFLIEANIMASIAILLMMGLRRFLRRPLGNGALCFGWLLVAARLLLPLSLPNPLINGIRSPFAMDAAIRPIAGQVKVRLTDALTDAGHLLYRADLIKTSGLANSLSWKMQDASVSIALAKIYGLGVAAILIWCVYRNARFRAQLRADRIEPISGQLLAQYEALCAWRGVKPVPVYFTDPLPSACLVGVLRPYIALPLTASPQDALHVLTHEVCHIKNRDNYWNVARLLCVALHWFNPLVWLAASMSRADSELRCDDRVTEPMSPEERKAYANVLVLAAARRCAPGMTVLATGMTMTGRQLKARVTTVLRGAHPLRWLAVSFAVLSSLCLAGAFATREARAVPRLLRSHPAISAAEITGEEQAMAYAEALWRMDDMGLTQWSDPEFEKSLTWEVVDYEPDAYYILTASTPDFEGLLLAHFDLMGNAVALSYNDRAASTMSSAITLNDQEQRDLFDDLKGYLTEVNPERAQQANYFQAVQEYLAGNARYIDIACWRSQAAWENNYDVTAYFTVELSPAVRIVYYNINYGDINGNG